MIQQLRRRPEIWIPVALLFLVVLMFFGAVKINVSTLRSTYNRPSTELPTTADVAEDTLQTVRHDGYRFIIYRSTAGVAMILHPEELWDLKTNKGKDIP